jgi:hypothetical protein
MVRNSLPEKPPRYGERRIDRRGGKTSICEPSRETGKRPALTGQLLDELLDALEDHQLSVRTLLFEYGDPDVACLDVRIPFPLVAAEVDANIFGRRSRHRQLHSSQSRRTIKLTRGGR